MGAEPLRVIEGGGPPRGWEALWRKDAWGKLDLPHRDLASMYRGEEFIRFERIGQPWLGVHPHLFRHNVGTSMVNDNIPLTVIQDVLDQGSIEMTARYARMRDETVRQAVKRWHERVKFRSERIALPTDGPLEWAAWMKERIARAKQALPNGYCGLPLVQSCPHPNACLSCESFLTDGSFRAVHEQQQAETRRLLEKARKQGSLRLIEVLGRDEQSLARILEGLEAIEADHADARGEELDLRDLARGEHEGA